MSDQTGEPREFGRRSENEEEVEAHDYTGPREFGDAADAAAAAAAAAASSDEEADVEAHDYTGPREFGEPREFG